MTAFGDLMVGLLGIGVPLLVAAVAITAFVSATSRGREERRGADATDAER